MPVRRVKPSYVEDWVADMIERGVSVSKITESLGVVKRVTDRVVRDRVIATNPCSLRAVSLPKRLQMERPVLSPAEVEKLAQAMTTNLIVCWFDRRLRRVANQRMFRTAVVRC